LGTTNTHHCDTRYPLQRSLLLRLRQLGEQPARALAGRCGFYGSHLLWQRPLEQTNRSRQWAVGTWIHNLLQAETWVWIVCQTMRSYVCPTLHIHMLPFVNSDSALSCSSLFYYVPLSFQASYVTPPPFLNSDSVPLRYILFHSVILSCQVSYVAPHAVCKQRRGSEHCSLPAACTRRSSACKRVVSRLSATELHARFVFSAAICTRAQA